MDAGRVSSMTAHILYKHMWIPLVLYQARSQGGGARGSAAPPVKVGAPQKNPKNEAPLLLLAVQTSNTADQATDLTVCKILWNLNLGQL